MEKEMYYKRDGTPHPNIMEWAKEFKAIEDRRVAKDILSDGKMVSTVFLGLNHNYGEGLPLIFETMVFASESDGEDLDMNRYSTEEEALKGHKKMVKKWTDKLKEQAK